MSPSNNDVWNARGEKWGGRFTRHPFWMSLAVIAVILAISTVGNFACGWFNTATKVAGPGNVTAQYQAVINDWNGMEQAACNAKNAQDAPTNANSPQFLEDPAFAYKAKYRQIVVDYNTRQNDIFESKLVGPKGYPQNAPTLEAMQAQVC
jgi:hypothetical protein